MRLFYFGILESTLMYIQEPAHHTPITHFYPLPTPVDSQLFVSPLHTHINFLKADFNIWQIDYTIKRGRTYYIYFLKNSLATICQSLIPKQAKGFKPLFLKPQKSAVHTRRQKRVYCDSPSGAPLLFYSYGLRFWPLKLLAAFSLFCQAAFPRIQFFWQGKKITRPAVWP